MSANQITMISLEELVNQDHQYRKFKKLFNFNEIEPELKSVESPANYKISTMFAIKIKIFWV